MLGGNDLDSDPNNLDLGEVVHNFMKIIYRLQEGGIPVVVSEVFFRGNCRYVTPELYQKLRSSLSKRLRTALKKYNIPLVHYPCIDKSWFLRDLVHLDYRGYQSIIHTLKKFF